MINIEELSGLSPAEQEVEIVERKGLGHPDTICDLIAEEISARLSKAYLKQTGSILHYNIDKILLSAGRTEKAFGGGRYLEPIKLFIGDRATSQFGDISIPVESLVKSSVKNWFRTHIPNLDLDYVETDILLKEGSEELTGIFKSKKDLLGANDTSAGIGYYPLTAVENLTYSLERYLNSSEFKKRYPFSGQDVKVMSCRFKDSVQITVAMPFIAYHIKDEKSYFKLKEKILSDIKGFVKLNSSFSKTEVYLNTLDEKGKGVNGVYITLSGTSAEDADSGEVGRGNRANGLISFMRPLGSEAVAGKNPVSHVGKIYNFFAFYLAERIYKKFDNLSDVYVYILSRIGSPISTPHMLSVKLIPRISRLNCSLLDKISRFCSRELQNIDVFCRKIISGKVRIL